MHVYREWTPRITVLALILGIAGTIASVYSGLKIANVVSVSMIAILVGMVFRQFRGSTMEVNAGQIMASSINVSAAGVIFTIPALYLLGKNETEVGVWRMILASCAGAIIGAAAIVPLRRRFLEIDQAPFPSGTAGAAIVRMPGLPVRSLLMALACALVAGLAETAKNTDALGFMLPGELPVGDWLGLPSYTGTAVGVSILLFAIGMITGRGGVVYLFGGLLAYWILAPYLANAVFSPAWLTSNMAFDPAGDVPYEAALAGAIYTKAFRPLGIGMFLGAALLGALLAVPVLKAVFAGMRGSTAGNRNEVSLKAVVTIILSGAVVLYVVAFGSLPWWRSLLVVAGGLTYLFIANMVLTECTGRTAQQPVSGLSFIGAVLVYFLSGGDTVIAVFMGAAVCSGITQGGDMMDDLKTAQLIGANTWKAQVSQLLMAPLGPVVAVLTVIALAHSSGFGPESQACIEKAASCLPAPQATALADLLRGLSEGGLPTDLYLVGAGIGGALTLLPIGGAGVLFGIAFYLPLSMTLTYGLGCLTRMGIERALGEKGEAFVHRYIIPAAGGAILGEALVGVFFSLISLIPRGGP